MSELKKIERDENNLIKGLNYTFDDNGLVNWRKLIKPEHLIPNKDRTQEIDVTKLEDKDLLILLQGTKELAMIRGFTSVTYNVVTASPEYCCMACKIKWIPNFETEGREVEFESIGDASLNSTDGFASKYLGPISENRAFVRCVRNFLRISIISKEEIGGPKNDYDSSNTNSPPTKQLKMLEDLMARKFVKFDPHIIKKLKDANQYKEEYTSVDKLPKEVIFDLLERLKKYNP